MNNVIELRNVVKKFGDTAAVDGIDLSVAKGDFFGLLGPNGAGKTTMFRMMTTLLKPDEGRINMNGFDMNRNRREIKKTMGMVSQHISLQSDMTAEENLELHGMLHKMDRKRRKQRIEELLEFSGLSEHRKKLAGHMSGGMKRRLMIVRALMHEPSVLFMDEPTVGLDPSGRRSIWDILKNLNRQGLTVLLTTHYIEEAEVLCNTVALMDHGKIIAQGNPEKLKQHVGAYVLETFKEGKTRYGFFPSEEEALSRAREIGGELVVRRSNLEDLFLKLMNNSEPRRL
ncbi:MAG: ABC transporter ATP-binding protein, partial [Bacillota bacterium]|nr:ABC transporter ATP-binding protein [Bacillota bacterium]